MWLPLPLRPIFASALLVRHGALPAVRLCATSASVPAAVTQQLEFDALPIAGHLKQALKSMGLTTATPVQAATCPPLLEGRDVVAKARTGTGKTVAFLVPTLHRLSTSGGPTRKLQIRALVLSPTRELAAQIAEAANSLVAGSELRTACIFGGTSMAKDKRALSGQVDLLVATPGRLADHMQNEGLTARLAGLEVLILDEGDRLLDAGFSNQIRDVVRQLPKTRQSLCFSATMPPDLTAILGQTLRPDYLEIDCVGTSPDARETASRVSQSYMSSDMNSLPGLAAAAVRMELATRRGPEGRGAGKVIVFCPTANQAQFISELFSAMGVPNDPLHSRKSQGFRTRVSNAFRDAAEGVVVASDVAARGVDYPDVSLVIQLGAPDSREQYVHRTGRTGRAGKSGAALLLLSDWEEQYAMSGMLKGMPIERQPAVAAEEATAAAMAAVSEVDEVTRQKAYQAWLGYYKAKLKALKWDGPTLVEYANGFARGALGLDYVPLLQAKTVGQMGLRGTPGLNVAKGASGAKPQGRDNSNRPYSGRGGGTGQASSTAKRGRGGVHGEASGRGGPKSRGRGTPKRGRGPE